MRDSSAPHPARLTIVGRGTAAAATAAALALSGAEAVARVCCSEVGVAGCGAGATGCPVGATGAGGASEEITRSSSPGHSGVRVSRRLAGSCSESPVTCTWTASAPAAM